MRSFVWDTGAISLFFADNDVANKIMKEIYSGKSAGYVPQLIFSELYYKTWQIYGEQAALLRTQTLRESPLKEYILQEKDTYTVGKSKLNYSFLSMIDAVVVASAKGTSSTIVTTDGDFLKVKGVKVKKLKFD